MKTPFTILSNLLADRSQNEFNEPGKIYPALYPQFGSVLIQLIKKIKILEERMERNWTRMTLLSLIVFVPKINGTWSIMCRDSITQ